MRAGGWYLGVAVFLFLTTTLGQGQTSPVRLPAANPSIHKTTFQPHPNLPKYAPDRLLVRFRPGTTTEQATRLHVRQGTRVSKSFSAVRNLQLVRLPAGAALETTLRDYRKDPSVLYAEPDYVVHLDQNSVTPNDPRFPELWGMQKINAPQAWNLSTGSSQVVVGVIDTGVDYTHTDLAANLFRNEADCNSNGIDDDGNGFVDDCYGIDAGNADSDPMDDHGHGTHVAGTIGAAGNNGVGVVGVNWNVKIAACKFIGSDGYGTTSGAIACLEYFAMMKDRGVNLVATNNSWGGDSFSQALYDAIDAHRQRGLLFITSAGNSGQDTALLANFPSDYYLPNVIAVAASDTNDNLAIFSNFGRRSVHLAAPGVDILSTTPFDNYAVLSGTSMAAPHVTGAAALLKAQEPTRDWKSIRNLLLAGGDSSAALTETITQRRLNVAGAMSCSNSVVRSVLQPRTTMTTTSADLTLPVTLAVLHINCGVPNGNLSVSVDGGAETVTLLDDGLGADQEAGDGIYSAQWFPPSAGVHSLTFPGGEVVTVQVLSPYRFSSTSYAYRTIAGNPLSLQDDDSALVTPPFPILFGGGSFDHLYVNTNGNVSFTAPFTNPYVDPLPTPTTAALVAPFWDDLAAPVDGPDPFGTSHNVFWDVVGAAPSRELVIEWRDISHVNPACWGACYGSVAYTVKFQIVFFEGSSNILFNYADTIFGTTGPLGGFDHGHWASVGVQVSALVGTQYSFNSGVLNDGTAILWELGNPVPAVSELWPFSTLTGSPAFDLKISGQSFVPGAVARWNGTDRPVNFVTSSQLKLPITDAELANPASVQVAVFDPVPGGGLSNALPFDIYSSYPIPALTSFTSYDRIFAGRPSGTTLYVYGSNFVMPSVLRWNGSDRPTKPLSKTQLSASLFQSDFSNAGVAEITVFNPAPGGGTSTPLSVAIDNPVPVIDSLVPAWTRPGGPDFTLTVGSWPYSFNSSSVVRWNGSDRPTTYVDVGTVRAAIPAADIAAAGSAQVTVYNPPPGGGASQAFRFDIVAPPPNDNFANAIEAAPLPFTYTVDSRAATTEASDPVPYCGQSYSNANSVWYKYTATRDITLHAWTNGSYSDMAQVLYVWDGVPGSMGLCVSEWDSASVAGVETSFPLRTGTTAYFMITDDQGRGDPALSFTLGEGVTYFPLTVTLAGAGGGTVTSNPAGINCGVTCSASFAYGTVVKLIPSPGPGSVFLFWDGACVGTTCSVPMSAARSVTATFGLVPPPQTLTVTLSGNGLGTVTSSPSGINCGATCSAAFASGSVVTLTAMPAGGSTFAGWSGACNGTSSCEVTMDAAKSVTASFSTAPALPDFGFGPAPGASTSAGTAAGGTAKFNLDIAPNGGFTGSISFACTGAPAASTCSITPNPASVSGTAPTAILVSVTTAARSSSNAVVIARTGADSGHRYAAFWAALLICGALIAPGRRPTRNCRHMICLSLACLAIALALALLIACGGGGGGSSSTPPPPPGQTGTPAGTYTIIVTGVSGSVSHNVNLQLTVN